MYFHASFWTCTVGWFCELLAVLVGGCSLVDVHEGLSRGCSCTAAALLDVLSLGTSRGVFSFAIGEVSRCRLIWRTQQKWWHSGQTRFLIESLYIFIIHGDPYIVLNFAVVNWWSQWAFSIGKNSLVDIFQLVEFMVSSCEICTHFTN